MQRVIHTICIILLLATATGLTGCGNNGEGTEQHEGHEHGTYQCPMDCEAGKTYEEPGACPVCKMDLVEIENS